MAVAVAAAVTAAIVVGTGTSQAAESGGRKVPNLLGTSAKGVIKDSYIVVLKGAAAKPAKVAASATSLSSKFGGTVTRTFARTIHGYAAHMTAAQAKKVAASPDVAYVQQNKRVSKADTQLDTPSWGLDRVDQIFAPINKRYTYPNTASNVHAYVIDTGIRISHSDFGGRASYGYDFIDNDAVADDCNGHGTHVAGTLGGTTYGIAKAVQLVGVRVLDCEGFGSIETVVAGIEWVTANAAKPAVANLSLGLEGIDPALDAAVKASIASGVTYAVAAGNDSVDACTESPADVSEAITVGATDEVDYRTSFSNYGSCVDIFAPGNAIPSDWNTSDTGTNTISGTSMASPHVAGAAALALSANPTWTPAEVRNFLVYGGTRRVVRNVASYAGTTDVMLRIGTNVVPQVTGLRSLTNGKNISVGTGGTQPIKPVSAPQTMGDLEKFTTLSVGDGYYTFASWANGKLINATNNGTGSLIANGSTATDSTKFKPIMNGDGTVTLQAKINGKYVTAPNGGTSPLVASASTIGTAEKFIWASPSAIAVLRARVNNKLVTTQSNNQLLASVTTAQGGNNEQFDMLDLGGDVVALRSHRTKQYVYTPSNGAQPLLASGATIGTANKFYLIHGGDEHGAILLQSVITPTYRIIEAPNSGNSPLIANWEYTGQEVLPPNILFGYEPIRVG